MPFGGLLTEHAGREHANGGVVLQVGSLSGLRSELDALLIGDHLRSEIELHALQVGSLAGLLSELDKLLIGDPLVSEMTLQAGVGLRGNGWVGLSKCLASSG